MDINAFTAICVNQNDVDSAAVRLRRYPVVRMRPRPLCRVSQCRRRSPARSARAAPRECYAITENACELPIFEALVRRAIPAVAQA